MADKNCDEKTSEKIKTYLEKQEIPQPTDTDIVEIFQSLFYLGRAIQKFNLLQGDNHEK